MSSNNYLLAKGVTYFVVISALEYLQQIDADPKHPMGDNPRKTIAKTFVQAAALTAIHQAYTTR